MTNFPVIHRRDLLIGSAALLVGSRSAFAAVTSLNAPEPAPPGAAIVRAAVFPAIGVARIGNAASWYLAPELPGYLPEPDGGYKDGPDGVKKQVQRFRVFGFDAAGRVVRELTAADGLSWTVHAANTKAAWYAWNNPLDLGAAAPGISARLRNDFIAEADRERLLVIDPGPVSIAGASTNSGGGDEQYNLLGRFWASMPVSLGHLATDEQGRLLFFPPDGISRSALPNNPISDVANNDGWHDDASDGPVGATVRLADGRTIEAEPAWVVCCAPKYVPEIMPLVSMYDVIRDVMIDLGHLPEPQPPYSFRADVFPFLHRLGLMQWVSSSTFLAEPGFDLDRFADDDYLRRLADPSAASAPLRRAIFAALRDPASDLGQPDKLPFLLGDGADYTWSPLHWFRIPPRQYDILRAWAEGSVVDDSQDAAANAITSIDDVPLAQQPDTLSRAALESCLGGAFHPGMELTWPMRHHELYRTPSETPFPFRIARSASDKLAQYVGLQLNPTNLVGVTDGSGRDAPIGRQPPGGLTRWFGVPWQNDIASCQSVLTADDFPTAVWWPANTPTDVLSEHAYNQLMRQDLATEDRRKFFDTRVAWTRGVTGVGYHADASYLDGLRRILYLWSRMGFIARRPGPTDAGAPPGLPREMFVEVQRGSVDLKTPSDSSGG